MSDAQQELTKIREAAHQRAFARAQAATAAPREPDDSDLEAQDDSSADDSPEQDEPSADDAPESAGSEDESGEEPEVSIDEVRELLSSGKVRALAKKLGVDPKEFDVHPAKLRRIGKAKEELAQVEQRVNDLKREAARIQAENVTTKAELSARGARIEAIERAVKTQSWADVAAGIEQLLPVGMTYGRLTQLVAQGHRGGAPAATGSDPEVRRELEELKRKLAEREERDQTMTREQQAQRDREHVRSQLAQHELSKLDGFEDMVIAEMHKHWDPATKGFRKSLKAAADEIVKRERAKAAKLLGVKPGTKPVVKRTPPRDDDSGRFVVPTTKETLDPREAAHRRAFAAALRKTRGVR